jgi:hypothetical protein
MLEIMWPEQCCERSGRPYSSPQVVSRVMAVLQQQMQPKKISTLCSTLSGIRLDLGVLLSWLQPDDV